MRASSTVSSKGQIVIPVALRKKYRLREGTTVHFREDHGHLVLDPDPFAELLALGGTLDYPLEEDLMAEREAERLREDREDRW